MWEALCRADTKFRMLASEEAASERNLKRVTVASFNILTDAYAWFHKNFGEMHSTRIDFTIKDKGQELDLKFEEKGGNESQYYLMKGKFNEAIKHFDEDTDTVIGLQEIALTTFTKLYEDVRETHWGMFNPRVRGQPNVDGAAIFWDTRLGKPLWVRSRYLMQMCDIATTKAALTDAYEKPRVIACLETGLCLVSCHMPKLRGTEVNLQRVMFDAILETVHKHWKECHTLIICADYNRPLSDEKEWKKEGENAVRTIPNLNDEWSRGKFYVTPHAYTSIEEGADKKFRAEKLDYIFVITKDDNESRIREPAEFLVVSEIREPAEEHVKELRYAQRWADWKRNPKEDPPPFSDHYPIRAVVEIDTSKNLLLNDANVVVKHDNKSLVPMIHNYSSRQLERVSKIPTLFLKPQGSLSDWANIVAYLSCVGDVGLFDDEGDLTDKGYERVIDALKDATTNDKFTKHF